MKRTENIDCLKKLNKKGMLMTISKDGPTSMFVAVKGEKRIVTMNITEAGTAINLIVGRFFKRRHTISLRELDDLQ